MFRFIASSLIISTAAPLFAQASAQTECRTDYFGVTRCTTQNASPRSDPYRGLTNPSDIGRSVSDSFNRGAEAAAQRRLLNEQQEAQKRQQEAALAQAQAARVQEQAAAIMVADIEEQKQQGREAAKLVAAGDCAGAEGYALGVGNINLAKTVREYCAAARK